MRARPQLVQKALDGYEFSNIGLLAAIPHPPPAMVHQHRHLIMAIGAALTFALWSIKSKDYGTGRICRWEGNSLECDGLFSLIEAPILPEESHA